ncbi:MAG: SufD family Fe-S cluster assembly protein [Candidatus Pacebacteria bacterium]|nr:SufD family Fe-S cluster assembly protein [Candidatus Paceibacterota bacterium]PIR60347.1 MAG: hypothetical protein COU67_02640 [Candidatus Pacebacteria bacterium CG10_big_fil_rev_8_21_14_0_10_44_54]
MIPVAQTITTSQEVVLTKPGKYEFSITKPGVELSISGSFRAAGSESKKVSIIIRHQAPHTIAKTKLHGVVSDKAFLSFWGKIQIDPECPDTNSFLTERILLLSPTARAEAVPELEILTDDVKCSHAASISSIPEEQLFYLMSRGLSRKKAEGLIVAGFLGVE